MFHSWTIKFPRTRGYATWTLGTSSISRTHEDFMRIQAGRRTGAETSATVSNYSENYRLCLEVMRLVGMDAPRKYRVPVWKPIVGDHSYKLLTINGYWTGISRENYIRFSYAVTIVRELCDYASLKFYIFRIWDYYIRYAQKKQSNLTVGSVSETWLYCHVSASTSLLLPFPLAKGKRIIA